MSNIKGGGRAQLTQEAENSIIGLLYDLRDHKIPLLSAPVPGFVLGSGDGKHNKNSVEGGCGRTLYDDLNNHDKKKERKRFLKRLLKCHNRQALSQKLNQTLSTSEPTLHSTPSRPIAPGRPMGDVNNANISDAAASAGKIRIQLVEMIYKEKKDKPGGKKDEKKKSSKKEKTKKISWKEGAKKIVVLPRSTEVKELMVLCKAKLKIKKPSRIFIVDKDSNLEMDLVNDLRGLNDGDNVCVTSYATSIQSSEQDKDEEPSSTKEDEEEIMVDPLENIKKAYRLSSHKRGKVRKPFVNEKLPFFSDAIGNLEPLSESRAKLPAANYRSDILRSLDSSRVIVISGATGCGKSTQVPQFILEGMKAIRCGEEANIIVTQPRRVAAMALAKRVAEERKLPQPGRAGSEVGYNVRLAKAVSDDTKIVYCTVGVLLRMIVNPLESYGEEDEDDNKSEQAPVPLSDITTCIIDEVHERDLTTDFALTLLRPILAVNKKISIVLMSATASAGLFVDFFRDMKLGIEPTVFQIPGRTFPVEIRWLSDCEKIVSDRMNDWSLKQDASSKDGDHDNDDGEVIFSPRAKAKIDDEFIVNLISHIAQKQWNSDVGKNSEHDKIDGSVLVFLPGKGEIESLNRSLQRNPNLGNRSKCSILKLHSTLTPAEQWRAFQPVKNGIVKIVLSTNVAETSITIPDISVVIDTGRVKEMRFNPSTRIKELVTVWTSQASCKQRAGRAGRTGPGTCYKLYSEEFCETRLPRQTSPEIMRTPLEELILQVCLLEEQNDSKGTNPEAFLANSPEPPPKSNLQKSCHHLEQIGALTPIPSEGDNLFRLTPLGYHLSHLPMDTNVGKILVVGCILQCIEPALTIAATLSAPKSIWLSFIPRKDKSRQEAKEIQEQLAQRGFGGDTWPGGSVKGDAIACIAAYNAWLSSGASDKLRRKFASDHALDHNALLDIKGLRSQFKDSLRISGLLRVNANSHQQQMDNIHGDDPLLTSCCLVAGLYPNVATLLRPSKQLRIRGGFLITKNGDRCKASSDSFQCDRIRNAREGGKDAYAVYHGKHMTIGTTSTNDNNNNDQRRKQDPFLSNINFVSRFAILLFGGNIEVQKNCLIVDEWLKFKVGDDAESKAEKVPDKGQVNAVLIHELRKELDNVLLRHIMRERVRTTSSSVDHLEQECERVIQVVRQLLIPSIATRGGD